MNIERGDSVIFGGLWCISNGRKDLINKTVKLTPEWFEYDNGLFSSYTECPGIYDEVNEESESIYHLFGNNFEYFMDCKLIKGTIRDIEEYEKVIKDLRDAEAEQWKDFVPPVEL